MFARGVVNLFESFGLQQTGRSDYVQSTMVERQHVLIGRSKHFDACLNDMGLDIRMNLRSLVVFILGLRS